MVTRVGGLLVLTGAALSLVPWVAVVAVGAPMMIVGAIVLAVAIERTLDHPTPQPSLQPVDVTTAEAVKPTKDAA